MSPPEKSSQKPDQSSAGKVERYRRNLQDQATHPPRTGNKNPHDAAQEGEAAKLATEIQGEQSKAPKPHTARLSAGRSEEKADIHRKTANSRGGKR